MQADPADRSKVQNVTLLLRRFASGEQAAGNELMHLIERELHTIASRHLRKERKDHTLQTTALVNEAFMRLIGPKKTEWGDRNHFFAAASRVMRQILIDYARSHTADKRNGQKVELDAAAVSLGPVQPDLLDVDRALHDLAVIAPRQAQLVELRFFGGLSLEEAAGVLGVASRTADKDWALARAWLRRRLGPK